MKYIECLLCVFLLISFIILNTASSYASHRNLSLYENLDYDRANKIEFTVSEKPDTDTDSGRNLKHDVKSVSVTLSYNPEKSDIIKDDLPDIIKREIATTFIGSGYRYSTEENSQVSIKAFLDIEVSSYKQQDSTIYDIVSNIELKAYDKNGNLIKESKKNIFLSGSQLDQITVDASRKSSQMAAKDLLDKLEPLFNKSRELDQKAVSLKIEIIFRGANNYKYFNRLNSILVKSPYNLDLIKRTIEPGIFFSVIIISNVETDILASYIQKEIGGSNNLELSEILQNRLVFDIVGSS